MTTSPFRFLRDQLDGILAQGLRGSSTTVLEACIQECGRRHLSQPATRLQQVQQQVEQENLDQHAVGTLSKVLHTLKQAELLTCKPGVVDVSILQETRSGQRVYIACQEDNQEQSQQLDDLLAIPNPFVRTYRISEYLRQAEYEELCQTLDLLWFDYSLLPAIREGLTSRPDDALQLAQIAFRSKNLVMQRIALAVLEALGAHAAYRLPIIALLRERAKKTKEPMKYVVMETIANLEGTSPIYRLAQQKFFHEHAALIRQLRSSKKSERGKAVKALGRTKNPCFTEVLMAMLDDPEVGAVAPESLYKIGAFAAIPKLVAMLNGKFQHNAALALYKFGDRQGLEYFLHRKMRSPLESYVKFTEYGDLLLHPLMQTIKQISDPTESAKGCWTIFNGLRSRDFAARVLHAANHDPVLARQLVAVLQHAYPGQYTRLVPPDSDPVSDEHLSQLITKTLGPNPHTIVASLKDKYQIVTILATPDGAHVITLNSSGEVSVWNTTTWNKLTTFALPRGRHYSYLHAIALSPDGQYLLATNNQRHTLDVLRFHQWVSPFASLRHVTELYAVGTTSDGQYILGGGQDAVMVWKWGTWREVAVLSGHQHGVEVIRAVPGKPLIVTGDRQGTIQVWEQGSWQNITTLNVNSLIATSVACSQDGRYLVVVDTLATYLETKVHIWETATWSETAFLTIPSPVPISCFAFMPDGKYLITGSDEVKFLKVGTWQEQLILSNPQTRALAVLPDGQHVIAGQNVWKIDLSDLA